MERVIEVKGLKKAFGSHEVLRGVDFVTHKGEVTCIIGSSGSGKSTLLRCINLLETPDAGEHPLSRRRYPLRKRQHAALSREGRHGVSAVRYRSAT